VPPDKAVGLTPIGVNGVLGDLGPLRRNAVWSYFRAFLTVLFAAPPQSERSYPSNATAAEQVKEGACAFVRGESKRARR
jgi:hypothetical protein